MLNRFEQDWFGLTPTDEVLRHCEAMRVTAIQIGAKNFKLIHLGSKGTRLCWGKEEFCLPTKLHAPPSLAHRVLGRASCVLNAFGLFARSEQSSL
jgi:hypothetical protein